MAAQRVMSVYTKIPEVKIAMLCSQFGVAMQAVKPIQNGVENSNWFITADDGQEYVLTLYEERKTAEVKTLVGILKALADNGLPVAVPITHSSGLLHTEFQGKALQLAPRLPGEHLDNVTEDMCFHMGKNLAMLHDALAMLSPPENYALAQFPWEEKRDTFMKTLSAEDKKLMYKVWQAYDRAQVATGYLPQGLTHGDLFLDNTLWKDSELTGLLDFTEVCVDHLLMDIAITANDACTDWDTLTFDDEKYASFLRGYQNIRDLTPAEQNALPEFLAMAACRFWLLRLDIAEQNAALQRDGEDVLVKSPQLMRDLAAFHFSKL